MWPRIFGMGMELSKQWWGASGWAGAARGLGETNTEIMKRHLKDKIRSIEKHLKEYEQMRELHRIRRKRVGFPVFWIVWYTNAGKSSLMHILCQKEVYIADKLFATLGTEVGKLYLHSHQSYDDSVYIPGKEVLVIDTIWFMRDLPPQLIKAFASTLEDSIQSDVLLHVVDATDPDRQRKVEIVHEILKKIKANQKMLYVFNKIDKLDDFTKKTISDQFFYQDHCFLSALSGEGIEELKQKMLNLVV